MSLHPRIAAITAGIRKRSEATRSDYLARIDAARRNGPNRGALGCGNLAHGFAASGGDKPPEMLSTHPSDQTRIAGLTRRLTTSVPLYDQARAQGKKPLCKA